jgi:hypothetical protein
VIRILSRFLVTLLSVPFLLFLMLMESLIGLIGEDSPQDRRRP